MRAFMGRLASGEYWVANRKGDVVKTNVIEPVPAAQTWSLEFLRNERNSVGP